MKDLFIKFTKWSGLYWELKEYKWYRKLLGGDWYLIYNWLPMNPFWSERIIISCGGRAIKTEKY